MFSTVWSTAATVVTQSSDRPYFTNAAGPTSHSPEPMEEPRRMAPGPITPRTPSPGATGGRGSSPFDQGGSAGMGHYATMRGFARSNDDAPSRPHLPRPRPQPQLRRRGDAQPQPAGAAAHAAGQGHSHPQAVGQGGPGP